MTDAQWLFEYNAIKNKEKDQINTIGSLYKNAVVSFRETLIELLGLHIAADDNPQKIIFGEGKDRDEVEVSDFTPLVLLAGNPAMIEGAFKNREDASKVADALDDPEFEAFSAALEQDLVGDMDPVILGPTDPEEIMKEKWFSPYTQDMVESLGIKSAEDRTKIALDIIKENNSKQSLLQDKQKKKMKFRFNNG